MTAGCPRHMRNTAPSLGLGICLSVSCEPRRPT